MNSFPFSYQTSTLVQSGGVRTDYEAERRRNIMPGLPSSTLSRTSVFRRVSNTDITFKKEKEERKKKAFSIETSFFET